MSSPDLKIAEIWSLNIEYYKMFFIFFFTIIFSTA